MANKRTTVTGRSKPKPAIKKAAELKPGPIKLPQAARTDQSAAMNVTSYSVRVYPGQYGLPPADGNYAGTDLGYMILMGPVSVQPSSITVKQFFIHFVPDGLKIPKGGYSAAEQAIEVVMNWSQFGPLLKLLKTADSVQAYWSSAGGISWADVEGQFTRK